MLVEEGKRVKAGEILARLDTFELENDIAQAEAALAIARANLQRLQVGANPAEIAEAERALVEAQTHRPLNKAQVTVQAADISATQAKLAYLKSLPLPADISVAEAEVAQAQTNLNIIRSKLEQTVLIAPLDAVVTHCHVFENEYAALGQAVIELGDPDGLVVQAEIEDADIARLRLGDIALITFEAFPDLKVQGSITQIMPNESPTETGFIIELEFEEIPPGVRWGMSADIEFSK